MHLLKRLWVHGLRAMRDEYDDVQDEIAHSGRTFRFTGFAFIVYCIAVICVGIYWSASPPPVTVKKSIQFFLDEQHLSPQSELPAGEATTATLIAIAETLLKKHGGFISNDMLPPGVWLDNMPHWELGVILQVRDMTQMLRGSFSQSLTNNLVDVDLQIAEVRFNFSTNSWMFPATESQYQSGIVHLKKYALRLSNNTSGEAHFYNDAEHLNDYLAGVEQRLKNLSQRLTASVGPRVNTDSAAMPAIQSESNGLSNGLYTQTPWYQVDDIFYEAQGTGWALVGLLEGMEVDFSEVLHAKNAQANYEQIIRELNSTQQPVYSPIILNGSGFGFVANHSLVMASYLARAQAAVADCRHLLLASTP